MKKRWTVFLMIVIAVLSVISVAACDGGNEDTGVTVTPVSVRDISSYPYTSYLPGEVFDITGLAIKVNMSNGRTGKYFDTDFTEWTHKDEPLTEDITKITVTVPDSTLTFDIDIFVGIPADSRIIVDSSMLGDYYYEGVDADFSSLRVKYYADGKARNVAASDWQLFEDETQVEDVTKVGLTEGKHTFTVKYNNYKESFDLTVQPASSAIYPRRFEAEDCCFKRGNIVHDSAANPACTEKAGDGCPGSNLETNTAGGTKQSTMDAEFWQNGALDRGLAIRNGASGGRTISSLAVNQNGLLVYFKFTVNVASAGKYNINSSLQPVGNRSMNGVFELSVNGGAYSTCTSNVTAGGGNRLAQYVDISREDGTPIPFTTYRSCFWYTYFNLGTYELREGANEIRIRMPNGLNGNIDYFEVTAADEPVQAEPKLISMRGDVAADVTDGTVYLDFGERLEDIVLTPELHPFKYTLLYLHLPDGNIVPVGAHMLGNIDYEKAGEQKVTVVCKKLDGTLQAITTFNVFISHSASE